MDRKILRKTLLIAAAAVSLLAAACVNCMASDFASGSGDSLAEYYVTHSKLLVQHSITRDVLRSIGWLLLQGLGFLADLGEKVYTKALSLLDITTADSFTGFVGNTGLILVGLFSISLVVLGIFFMVNPERIRKNSLMYGLFLAFGVAFAMTTCSTMLNDVVGRSYDALFGEQDGSVALAKLESHVSTLQYISDTVGLYGVSMTDIPMLNDGTEATDMDSLRAININDQQSYYTNRITDRDSVEVLSFRAVSMGRTGLETGNGATLTKGGEWTEIDEWIDLVQEANQLTADDKTAYEEGQWDVNPEMKDKFRQKEVVKGVFKNRIYTFEVTEPSVYETMIFVDNLGPDESNLFTGFYYQYYVEWAQAIVEMLIMILLYFTLAYNVVKMIFEIMSGQVLAAIFSTQIQNVERTKKIITGIFEAYMCIIFTMILIKIWFIGSDYIRSTVLSAEQPSGTERWIAIILEFFFVLCIVEGPSIVRRCFGFGVSPAASAAKMLLAGKAAGRVFGAPARSLGHIFVGGRSGGGRPDGGDGDSENGRGRRDPESGGMENAGRGGSSGPDAAEGADADTKKDGYGGTGHSDPDGGMHAAEGTGYDPAGMPSQEGSPGRDPGSTDYDFDGREGRADDATGEGRAEVEDGRLRDERGGHADDIQKDIDRSTSEPRASRGGPENRSKIGRDQTVLERRRGRSGTPKDGGSRPADHENRSASGKVVRTGTENIRRNKGSEGTGGTGLRKERNDGR